MRGFIRGVGRILKSYLTGPDGESYAPGRLMGFAMFVVGMGIVVVATAHLFVTAAPIDDWNSLLNALTLYLPALAATVTGLVLGIAPTDAGGRWWRGEASRYTPPPAEPPKGPSGDERPLP